MNTAGSLKIHPPSLTSMVHGQQRKERRHTPPPLLHTIMYVVYESEREKETVAAKMTERKQRRRCCRSSCILLLASCTTTSTAANAGAIFGQPESLSSAAAPPATRATTPPHRKSHRQRSSASWTGEWLRRTRGGSASPAPLDHTTDASNSSSSSGNQSTITSSFNEQEILDSFRREIRDIMEGCREEMQTILTAVERDVRHELQMRKEKQTLQEGTLLEGEEEYSEWMDDENIGITVPTEEDGEEDAIMQEAIKLDIFTELVESDEESEVVVQAAETSPVEDFLVGDTDEEDVAVLERLANDSKAPAATLDDNLFTESEEKELQDLADSETTPLLPEETPEALTDLDAYLELEEDGAEYAPPPKSNRKKKHRSKDKTNRKKSSVAVTIDSNIDMQSEKVVAKEEEPELAASDSEILSNQPTATEKKKQISKKKKVHRPTADAVETVFTDEVVARKQKRKVKKKAHRKRKVEALDLPTDEQEEDYSETEWVADDTVEASVPVEKLSASVSKLQLIVRSFVITICIFFAAAVIQIVVDIISRTLNKQIK